MVINQGDADFLNLMKDNGYLHYVYANSSDVWNIY